MPDMHHGRPINWGCISFGAIVLLGFFCGTVSGQTPARPAHSFPTYDLSAKPYAEFERDIVQSADRRGGNGKAIEDMLKDFRKANLDQSHNFQDWNYLLLNFLYRRNMRYEDARKKVLVFLPAAPVDILFRDRRTATGGPEKETGNIELPFDPLITQQRVLPYAEFKKIAMKSAEEAGIKDNLMEEVLGDFRNLDASRVINSQEWRFTLLELCYQKKISYKLADAFMSNLYFYPIDTGFLEEMEITAGRKMIEKPTGISMAGPRSGTPDIKAPVALEAPKPSYTEAARRAHISGIVVLQAVMHKDGTAGIIRVLRGMGYGLDESVIRTVKTRWRFLPAILDNEPIDVDGQIEVVFRLY